MKYKLKPKGKLDNIEITRIFSAMNIIAELGKDKVINEWIQNSYHWEKIKED